MVVFELKDKNLIKSCKSVLKRLLSKHKRKYVELFFHEKDIEFDKFDLMPLIKTKILKKVRNKFRANVQVFPLSGKFICTDFVFSIHNKKNGMYLRNMDDVWAILPHESAYIAKRVKVKKGEIVFDLATGSGIIAIFCAEKAKKVVAIDINPKAINYANFNAILNNVENKIDFRIGDMFKPVKGLKFDVIVWNGPTVAAPPVNEAYPIHSYGGPDGASFAKKFIKNVWTYLKPNGRIIWYDCSLGSQKYSVMMKKILEDYNHKKISVRVNHLNKNGPIPLSLTFKYFNKYRSKQFPLAVRKFKEIAEKEIKWIDWLRKKDFTHVYFNIITIKHNKKFSFQENFPKENIVDWRFIFREYHFMSYPTILKYLKKCEEY